MGRDEWLGDGPLFMVFAFCSFIDGNVPITTPASRRGVRGGGGGGDDGVSDSRRGFDADVGTG